MLAMVNYRDTLFWAAMIAWMMSVVLHEFAHGLVAYWGGDYTIRERGGLTLNPLQYVDPVMSILLPAVFLLMGGIPLPGGSTYIRRDLLRNREWDTAVSLAGPGMNILLFLACALPLQPRFGWFSYNQTPSQAQLLLGAMATLQFLAAALNLFPVPPLDGFQALSPWLPHETRRKFSTPPLSSWLFIGFFIAIWKLPILPFVLQHVMAPVLSLLGFDVYGQDFFFFAFDRVLFAPG